LTKFVFERRPLPLVVLDPAWVFCNRGDDRSKLAGPAQLAELADMAAQLNVAVVCVTDLRRENRGLGAFRTGGDRALNAAAQAGWGIVRHPQEHDKRLLLPLKMNVAPEAAAGLEFKIAEGRIAWEQGPAKLTAQSVFAAERGRTDQPEAEHWLQAYLANGSEPAKEIIASARQCGISTRTLYRAKAALAVRSEKREFNGDTCWWWSLANTAFETVATFANDGNLRANSWESDEGCRQNGWQASNRLASFGIPCFSRHSPEEPGNEASRPSL
jgi:hypothetical protein